MRSFNFEFRGESALNDLPLRDLDRERGRIPSAIVVGHAPEYGARVQSYSRPGSISKVFGQRLH